MSNKLSFSPQKGTKGHCFAAQVWLNGKSLAVIEDFEDPEVANRYARLFSTAPEMLDMLKEISDELALLQAVSGMTVGNANARAKELILKATKI